jgi:DNA polymerase III epsilon subunit family exonuclease
MHRPPRGKHFKPAKPSGIPRAFKSSATFEADFLKSLLSDVPIIVFDIETTGGNPERNGITEISALKIRNGQVLDKYYTLVNPLVPVPGIVRRMTGITNKMLKDQPLIEEVMPSFIEFIGSDVLVSHNTIGDLRFLRYFAADVSAHNLDNFFLCTHLLSEKLIPEAKDKSLKGLATFLGFAEKENHRAEADAIMTLELFKELMRRIEGKKISSLEQAIRFQGDTESAIRLGWGVKDLQLDTLPRSPGIFYLYDHNNELIFFSSSYNLQRDVYSLRQLHSLPKHLMKAVLRAHSIKIKQHHNFFSAFLDESKDPRRNQVSFHPARFHLRSVPCYSIDREGSKYRVSISTPTDGTYQIFGRINDQRQAHLLLKSLADIFEVEMTKKGFLICEKDLPLVLGFFRRGLDLHGEDEAKSLLARVRKWFKRKDFINSRAKIAQLREIRPSGDFDSLLGRNGIIVAQGQKTWQVYPVIHGRTTEQIEIENDPLEWIRTEQGRHVIETISTQEGKQSPPVTNHDEGVVNAVIWALSTSSGKSRDVVRFIGIFELREYLS